LPGKIPPKYFILVRLLEFSGGPVVDTSKFSIEFRVCGLVDEFKPMGDPLNPVAAHLTVRLKGPGFPMEQVFKALISQERQLFELLAVNGRNPIKGRWITLRGIPVVPMANSPVTPWIEVMRPRVSFE
jgi:hypothetical protein